MKREFRYSHINIGPLSRNAQHQFALGQTMKVYRSNAAYALIPKNACSTVRLSIALANGCIQDPSQIAWIHANNETFAMTSESAFLADYTFAILRSPFRRLYSAFLDKFLDMDVQSWKLCANLHSSVHPHEMTFSTFVKAINNTARSAMDVHWRPQVDFLLYDEYDDYFCLEKFDDFTVTVRDRIDLEIVDSRELLTHSSSQYRTFNGEGSYNTSALDLLKTKKIGRIPDIQTMYNSELFEIVSYVYRDDIALFQEKFPDIDMFPQPL